MSARRRRLASALLLLSLAGCARILPPPATPLGPEAQHALGLLRARWREFRDLRTLAEIRVRRGRERRALTGVLLARTPASVRLEVLSPFGQPVYLLAIHEGQLTAYDTTTNQALVGPATADTAARLLSLPFDPEQLVGVLAGRAVPPSGLRTAEVLPADEHGPSLSLTGTDHQQRVWMDFERGTVRQLEIAGGRYAVRVVYRYGPDGRLRGFDLAAADAWLTGTVRYRDPVFDGGIAEERFRLALPETAAVERVR